VPEMPRAQSLSRAFRRKAFNEGRIPQWAGLAAQIVGDCKSYSRGTARMTCALAPRNSTRPFGRGPFPEPDVAECICWNPGDWEELGRFLDAIGLRRTRFSELFELRVSRRPRHSQTLA